MSFNRSSLSLFNISPFSLEASVFSVSRRLPNLVKCLPVIFLLPVPSPWASFVDLFFLFMFYVHFCYVVLSVPCSLVIT